MASNYDDVLQQLQAAGLQVDSLDIGRLRRCKVEGDREKRGWYLLHEIRMDSGEDLIVGSYGVWRGAENNATKVELRRTELSREQRESLRQRLAEDKRRAEQARQADADRAAARATAAWRKCAEQGESDYLQRKGVGAHGVRFSPQGAMVVPMLDTAGRVHGLQIIRGRAQKGPRLEKEFWPSGLVKKGHFHLLGMGGPLMLVAEGYATAASLHEATGLPVAVAFDAGNLQPVAAELRKRYKLAKLLICADDDNTQRCQQPDCRQRVWVSDGPTCPHCDEPHKAANAGVSAASLTAMAVGGGWMVPAFAEPEGRRADWLDKGSKLNDFNDLHLAEGLHVVRAQVEARILALGWRAQPGAARAQQGKGGGDGADKPSLAPLRPIDSLDELLERYALVYGQGGTVFDHQEHVLVALGDMRDACLSRELHRAWAEHPEKQMVRVTEVGFDPACTDPSIHCNLWAGWPTTPKAGKCEHLLDLLRHMCAGDSRPEALYQWVLRWIAYPIQHPGAKMKTTLVIHGPQGTGKNMFFEALMAIYGRYGRVIDQSAIEDKFNDWASRKLFLIADEVVARSDLYHVKNKLKAFITGEWIRINPKNMAAYDERNHVNLVFLSNEAMPVVLEDDDRRHAVIWTPEKLSPDFYRNVLGELAAGGAAALHDYLLHLDLGDFTEGTLPPMTDAKRELIDLSKDSPSRFVQAFENGDIEGFPGLRAPKLLVPALSSDLFDLYSAWCGRVGLRTLSQPRFANALMRKHGAQTERKRYDLDSGTKGPHAITWMPGGWECPPGEHEQAFLGERVRVFRDALKVFRSGESK
jgi:putative DNA primase/helicase